MYIVMEIKSHGKNPINGKRYEEIRLLVMKIIEPFDSTFDFSNSTIKIKETIIRIYQLCESAEENEESRKKLFEQIIILMYYIGFTKNRAFADNHCDKFAQQIKNLIESRSEVSKSKVREYFLRLEIVSHILSLGMDRLGIDQRNQNGIEINKFKIFAFLLKWNYEELYSFRVIAGNNRILVTESPPIVHAFKEEFKSILYK